MKWAAEEDTGWVALELVSGFSGGASYRTSRGATEIAFDITGSVTSDVPLTVALPTAARPRSGAATNVLVIPNYSAPDSTAGTATVYIDAGSGLIRASARGGGTVTRMRGRSHWLSTS